MLSIIQVLVFSLIHQTFAHTGATGVDEDHTHEYHTEHYVELTDDPVYGVDPSLLEGMSREERQAYILPESIGGRLFVDRIDGQYLKLKKGQVVITIDDGPTPKVTNRVVSLLDEYNIRGVFFVVGNRVTSFPKTTMAIAESGHILGNHTYNHELDFPTVSDMYKSMTKANEVVAPYVKYSGQERCYVRTPGGVWSDWRKDPLNDHSVLRQCIGPFHWNIGGGSNADWQCWSKGKSAKACADGYYNELLKKGRGIILAHDLNAKTEPFLRALFENMQNEGIKNANGGTGFWEFMDMDELTVLDALEAPGGIPPL